MRGIVCRVSENWYFEVGEACLCGHLCVASLLLFIFFFQSLSIVLRCGGLLLNVIFSFSSARYIRLSVFAQIRVSCRCVIDAALIHWSLKYQCVERHNVQGVSCRPRFVCGMAISYTVLDTRMSDGFKEAVNRSLFPLVMFFSIFSGAGACGVAKAIYKQFWFSYLGLCFWFYGPIPISYVINLN